MSYSRKDTSIMRRVRDKLVQDGISVWTDEQLNPGTSSWKNAIESAVRDSDGVVVLMSPDSNQSEWVERELDYARIVKVPIFPVMVRGDEANAIPFELVSAQYVDVRHDFSSGIELLLASLKNRFGGEVASVRSVLEAPVESTLDTVEPILSPAPIYSLTKQIDDCLRLLQWYFFESAKFRGYTRIQSRKNAMVFNTRVVGTGIWVFVGVILIGSLWISERAYVAPFNGASNPYTMQIILAILLVMVGWSSTLRLGNRVSSPFALLGLLGKLILLLSLTMLIVVGGAFILSQGVAG